MPGLFSDSNAWFKILDRVSDAVLLADTHGEVMHVNPAAIRLLGKSAPEIIGFHLDRHIKVNELALELDRLGTIDQKDAISLTGFGPEESGAPLALTIEIEPLGENNGAAFAVFLRPLIEPREMAVPMVNREGADNIISDFPMTRSVFQLARDDDAPLKLSVVFVDNLADNILGLDDTGRFEDWFQNVMPEDRPMIVQAATRVWSTGDPLQVTARIFHPLKKQWRLIMFFANIIPMLEEKSKLLIGAMVDMTEALNLEKELVRNRLNIKYLLESIQDVVWLISTDGRLRFISRAAEEVYGRSLEEFYRDKDLWLNAVHPEDRARVEAESLEVLHHNREVAIDYRIVRPSGEVRFLRDRKKPVRDPEGCIIGIGGTITDITTQKETEEELIEEQFFIQRVLDTIPNVVYIYDMVEQKNIFANKRINTILGYSIEQIREMDDSLFETLLHPDDYKLIRENHHRLSKASDDEVVDLEYRMRHKNGEWRWLFSRERVFSRSGDGRPRQKIGSALDITVRKKAEERATIFHRFAEASIEGLGIGTLDGRIHYMNPALGRLVGLEPADGITGQSFLPYYPEEQRRRMVETVIPTVMEKGHWTGELKVVGADGKFRDTLENCFLIRDEKDQPLFIADIITDITERKRVEEELVQYKSLLEELVEERTGELKQKNMELEKEINERLKLEQDQLKFVALVENSRDLIGMGDLNGNIHYINRAGLNLLGLGSLEEALARKISDFTYDPESKELTTSILPEVKSSGYWRGEGRLRGYGHDDPVEVNIDIFTVTDPASGRPLCVGAIMRDIRELKKTEEALRDSMSKWRSIVEHAPDMILIVDRDGRILFVNRSSEAFGFKELIGKSIHDHFPQNKGAMVQKIIDSVFETGVSRIFEIDMPGPRGRVLWHLNHIGAIKTGQAVVAAIVIIRDITERKEAENRIRQSEETARALINAMPESAFLMEPDGKVLAINDLTAERLGLGVDEIMTRNMYDLLAPEVAEHRRKKVAFTVRTKKVVRFQDERCGRIIQNTISPVFDSKGKVSRLAILGVDVTDHVQVRKMLETQARELLRSNRDLEHFAYIASHDLQEPLRKITNFIELLVKRYKGNIDDRADRYIDYILDGAGRMRALIDDLLKYSRVGRAEMSLAPVDFGQVFDIVISDLKGLVKDTGAVVTHDPLPVIVANQVQIEQLLRNLFANALKFRGSDPPEVHLAYARNKKEHVFQVRDNGIGLDPKYKETIFQVFSRLHSKEEYPGTGIGLAICMRIVERHGGRIWVESSPGRGASFYFTLPGERTT